MFATGIENCAPLINNATTITGFLVAGKWNINKIWKRY